MNATIDRREFLRATALTGAGLALSSPLLGTKPKTVLVFTKSSGWEHDVVKRIGGKPSIVDDAVNDLGNRLGFNVGVTKDGRIFESKEFHSYVGVVFFTTGDLTTLGTEASRRCWTQCAGEWDLWECMRRAIRFTHSRIRRTARTATLRTEKTKIRISGWWARNSSRTEGVRILACRPRT